MFSTARSHANVRDNDADDGDDGGERIARKKGERREGRPSPRAFDFIRPVMNGHAHSPRILPTARRHVPVSLCPKFSCWRDCY